jgi:hypothetical protein
MVHQYGPNGQRPMIADERFLSWANQPNMRAIPRNRVVKLPTEFMMPYRWLMSLRANLPWIRRRWDQLIAVTLPGVDVKGDALLALADGAEIVDGKGRRLIWSDRMLGPVKARLIAHYTSLLTFRQTTGNRETDTSSQLLDPVLMQRNEPPTS